MSENVGPRFEEGKSASGGAADRRGADGPATDDDPAYRAQEAEFEASLPKLKPKAKPKRKPEPQPERQLAPWKPGDPCPLDELDELFSRRTVMGEAERTAVCLWIAHTYIFDRGFEYTGRLFLTSTHPSCGKSAVLRLVAKCSNGGVKLESGTTLAAIRDFRKAGNVTLCLDQLDGTGRLDNDDRKLVNLICSSTEVNAQHSQKEKVITSKGEKWETVTAPIGFPIALGKIGLLPGDAIMSRCFVVWMQPETAEERDRQMPERLRSYDFEALRYRLETWAAGVKAGYIKTPKGTPSRIEDIWQPLLAAAAHAGGRWMQRAFEAIAELAGAEEREEAREIRLLRQVMQACRKLPGVGITSPELDQRLGYAVDDKAASTRRGILLGHVGLKARKRTWHPGGPQVKGYDFSEIEAAARRQGIGE